MAKTYWIFPNTNPESGHANTVLFGINADLMGVSRRFS
jgi:hypothetical protein